MGRGRENGVTQCEWNVVNMYLNAMTDNVLYQVHLRVAGVLITRSQASWVFMDETSHLQWI